MAGLLKRVQGWLGIDTADAFIRARPAENLAMLTRRLSAIEGMLLAAPPPAPDTPESTIATQIAQVIDRARTERETGCLRVSWDDVLRCEILLARLIAESDLPTEVTLHIERLRRFDEVTHDALRSQWLAILDDARLHKTAIDAARARGVLAAALERTHWHEAQRYLIRKLGVLYASRLVTVFVLAVLFSVSLVLWEVYLDHWPLTEARFWGFAVALVGGLLGASFSALTRQRDIAGLDNIEEVRTAIGYPMILLRLGVGTGAATILYFVFMSGLVEGLLFPDLAGLGFDPVGGRAARPAGSLVDLHGSGAARLVPNADLSRLMVWSFLAGFSEQFVPSILGRVEAVPAKRRRP